MMRIARFLLGRCLAATVAVLIAVGCRPPLPPSTPVADLTAQQLRGYALFQTRCAGCHYADSEKGLHGPGLQGLFKKQYLPSGTPANDDRVTSVVLHGRSMMPAFGNSLDEQQLADLIAYLHTL